MFMSTNLTLNYFVYQVKPPNCVPPEVSSVSAAEESRNDATGRRIVVASSVMSDERAPRSSAPLTAQILTQSYLITGLLSSLLQFNLWFIIK